MGFRKWFGLFYTVKVRNISVSEEIKTIEEQDTEDNMTTLFGLMPWFRRYDTHCYSPRYSYVPVGENQYHETLQKLDILMGWKYGTTHIFYHSQLYKTFIR